MKAGKLASSFLVAGAITVTAALPAGAGSGVGRWEVAQPPLSPRTADHTTTALATGKVLLVGGLGPGEFSPKAVGTAELFDPATGRWTKTGALTTGARQYHSATRLGDGRVLLAGGIADGKFVADTELYDPTSGAWEKTGAMHSGRIGHSATSLPDGRVLVAGGVGAGTDRPTAFATTAETFDPGSGTWADAAPMPVPRAEHTATLLPDGTVLVAGGHDGPQTPALRDALLFDPKAGGWTTAPRLMATGRAAHTASLLDDGTVMVVGGSEARDHGGGGRPLRSTEVYDPTAGAWQAGPPLVQPRLAQATATLPGGKVLVVGGLAARKEGVPQAVASAEVYDPGARRWSLTAPLPGVPTSRRDRVMRVFLLAGHPSAIPLTTKPCGPNCGRVLVVGGDSPSTEAQLFSLTASGSQAGKVPFVATGAGAVVLAIVGVGMAKRRRRRADRWR